MGKMISIGSECAFHKIRFQKFSKVEIEFFFSNEEYTNKMCYSCRYILELQLERHKIIEVVNAQKKVNGFTEG